MPVRYMLDSSHMLLFFAVTIFIKGSFSQVTALHASLSALAIAILIEFLQPLTGRSAEFHDFIFDCIGIGLAWILLQWQQEDTYRRSAMTVGVSLLLGIVFLVSIIPPTAAYMAYRNNLPVLSDFSQPWYKYLWTSGLNGSDQLTCRVHDKVDQPSSFVCSTTQEGLNTIQFTPGIMNWTPYAELLLDVDNPGVPFDLHVRVDDTGPCSEYACRFNHVVRLAAGENKVLIPLKNDSFADPQENINMAAIVRVVLFTRDVPVNTILKIHRMSLR